ncbi:MAG: hypothetical protein PHR44_01220 [Candidatus Omnitrophica bacterium]|nr:hypothetical protein [Candidatus Omnitrophota bacterium]
MIHSKILERLKFLSFVRKALATVGMSCFADGRYIRGQMIIKMKDGCLLRREDEVKFSSERLNSISKRYALISLDRLFAEDAQGLLRGIYRLNFQRKDLDMVKAAAEYERDETCVFAAPNFVIAPTAPVPATVERRRGQ